MKADPKWAGKTAKCPNCKSEICFPSEIPGAVQAPMKSSKWGPAPDPYRPGVFLEPGQISIPPESPHSPESIRKAELAHRKEAMAAAGLFDFNNATPRELNKKYKQIAKESGDLRFFTRKELKHLPRILADGEQVLAFSSGMMEHNGWPHSWLIVLTDRRIYFLDKGFIYGLVQIAIDLDKINAVSGSTGILFGQIGIQDSQSLKVIDQVFKQTVLPFTNKVRDAIDARKNKLSVGYSIEIPRPPVQPRTFEPATPSERDLQIEKLINDPEAMKGCEQVLKGCLVVIVALLAIGLIYKLL